MEAEKPSNSLNLENLLAKAPSEEIRNEMLVEAVEKGLTSSPEHLEKAVSILESQHKYAVLGSIYSNKNNPFYNTDEAIRYYQKGITLGNFKAYAKSQITTGAVLKEMWRNGLKGLKETLKFFYEGFTLPSSIRKSVEKAESSNGEICLLKPAFSFVIEGAISLFATPYIGPAHGFHNARDCDIYCFTPLLAFGATNIASGLYEWYRYEKNKLEKAKSGGLEEKIESPEKAAELPISTMPVRPVQLTQIMQDSEETQNTPPQRQKLAE